MKFVKFDLGPAMAAADLDPPPSAALLAPRFFSLLNITPEARWLSRLLPRFRAKQTNQTKRGGGGKGGCFIGAALTCPQEPSLGPQGKVILGIDVGRGGLPLRAPGTGRLTTGGQLLPPPPLPAALSADSAPWPF